MSTLLNRFLRTEENATVRSLKPALASAQQRWKRSRELGNETRAQPYVEVAHRVRVDGGAAAAGETRRARRRLADQVLEHAVELVESLTQLIAGRRCDAFACRLEAGRPVAARSRAAASAIESIRI